MTTDTNTGNGNDAVNVIEPDQKWEVDFFRPEDAQGVARLFREVYGNDYPVKTFIEPERLIEENAAQRTISSVARTEKGDIIGHNALYRSAPFERLYEGGAGLVLPSYRGGFAAFRVVEHSIKAAPLNFNIEAVFGEAVCNHIRMQKISAKLGMVACAIEVDLMPASAYVKEQSAAGRVATVLDFKVFKPRRQVVHLPPPYDKLLRFAYDGIDHDSRFATATESLPTDVETRIETSVFDFAQVARLAVHEAGADFAAAFDKEEKALQTRNIAVHQAWLKLTWPWVGEAVQALRSRGYFIGGLLPRWFDVDGLLLQKISGKPNWEEIQVYSERARHILEAAKTDWAGTRDIPS